MKKILCPYHKTNIECSCSDGTYCTVVKKYCRNEK
jgi:hypothetical protein